jgi:glycosyltransferase involved in cell wall biosynthesis
VIVVDDGSNDTTADLAKKTGALVFSHLINRGQGAAIETGKRHALGRGADIVVTFDADGQFLPSEINDVVKPVLENRADVVLGSRFRKSKVPVFKKILLRGAVFFTYFTSGLNLSDTHNGFRAFSKNAAERIQIRQDRMAHASEILNQIAQNKLKYTEVPVTLKYSSYHLKKGQKIVDYFKILFDLFLGKVLN